MYEFIRGPLVWIAFFVFIFGSIYRLVHLFIQTKKDKVVFPYLHFKFGLRSILHWIVPFGSTNMRKKPVFTIVSFLFHICLLITPVFTLGHTLSWEESWGIGWWALPEQVSNIMTIIVIMAGIIFLLRRLSDPAVRYVTALSDYIILTVVLSPFVTGLFAYYQLFDYKTILTLHIFLGCLWLMIIPFTRIVHMMFFALTRAYMGSEFGYVRNSKDW
jgi:nitrate reductase gamma subunit